MLSIIRTSALAALALGVVAIAVPASAVDMSTIDKRKELMKEVVLKNFKMIKEHVEKGKGTADDVKKAADALAAAAPKIAPLFPDGTGRPDVDAKKTRAKPEIWLDWEKFKEAAMTLETEAKNLSAVAASGDKAKIAAQFGMTGKNGCGGCHKTFRGDKVK